MRIGTSNKCGAHCTLGANIFIFSYSTNVQKDIYFMSLLIIQIRPYELSFFQVFEPHKFPLTEINALNEREQSNQCADTKREPTVFTDKD